MNRTMDATFLNGIANIPSVREQIGGGMGYLDLQPLLSNPANHAIVNDLGGFVAHQLFPGGYELHSIFTPERRGVRSIIDLLTAFLEYMFTATPCEVIWTKVPEANKGAAWLARKGGFVERFQREAAWDGKAVSYQNMTLDMWVALCSPGLQERGRMFRDHLEATERAKAPMVAYPGDEAHHQALGVAFAMVTAGQIAKGVGYYNRLAVFVGWPAMSPEGNLQCR